MRYKKTLRLSEILHTELPKSVNEKIIDGLNAMHIIDTWHEVLGPHLSKYSSNEHYEKGKLTVRIQSSILRNDLFMQRTKLLERLNARLTSTKVNQIELL